MWLARPMGLQVFSRVLQGTADAIIYTVGMTIILDTVSMAHVAEYMGHVMIAFSVGTFAGPLLGGAVFDAGGYHAVWGMMLGLVVLDTVLRLIMLEKNGDHHPGADPDDSVPTIKQDLSLEDCKQQNNEIPTSLADSSKRARHMQLPDIVLLLSSPRMLVGLWGVCVQSIIFSGLETVLSIYVQDIWDYTALGAGLIFIPLTIPAFLGPLLGRVVDRTTPRWALVAGFSGMCPVLVLMRFVTYNSMGQKVLLCFFLFMIGVGVTMTLCPLTAEISYVAEEFEKSRRQSLERKQRYGGGAYGQAYALFQMAWGVGNIVGPLTCGLIKDQASWGSMCWVLGLISGITAIPCYIFSGHRKTMRMIPE
jgi:MFS family permease